jgi:hypothetical protein
MLPRAALSETQVLVFDTGPLWELVLYSAVHKLRFLSLKTKLRYLQSDSSYPKLSDFIAAFQKKTTTPHVVAEMSARIIRTEPKGQSAIWGLVYAEFSSMRMDERVMKLLEMPQRLVASVGAVDAGVVRLGLSIGEPNCLVLSLDRRLISECRQAGLNVKDLWEVISV